ncbi:uncharacterized protein LOC130674781 [Microplitis mediator]|uniref:uncharacterized protein LOC130674640 n=1 Tax=Microplitis mediator TaxID=375433 RepID=UPI00255568F2|nr:uncharacterized protein LOC130674640 [Microplitis mediator]XP_057336179.1 uncharacterized protein LOC130674781 [Microplitis mediator]
MQLWALVLWSQSCERDILKYDSIKFNKSGDASAKCKNKFYALQILRTSEDKEWLESLEVDTNGNVKLPQNLQDNNKAGKEKENGAKKKKTPVNNAEGKSSIDGVKNILGDIFPSSKVAESSSSDGDLSDRGYSPTQEEKIVDPRTGSRVTIVKANIEYDKRIEKKFVCSTCKASQKDFTRGYEISIELMDFFREKISQFGTQKTDHLKPPSQSLQSTISTAKSSGSIFQPSEFHSTKIKDVSDQAEHHDLDFNRYSRSLDPTLVLKPKDCSSGYRKQSSSQHSRKILPNNQGPLKQPKKAADSHLITYNSPSPENLSPYRSHPTQEQVIISPSPSTGIKLNPQPKESSNKDPVKRIINNKTDDKDDLPPWNVASDKKEQLGENSGVFINSVNLKYVKTKFKEDSPETARRLFKYIIGEEL